MKTSVHSYAKALFELKDGASRAQTKLIAVKFLQDLKNQRMLSQVEKILEEFVRLADAAEGIVRATVTSVHKVSKNNLDEAAKLVLKRVKGDKVVWTEIIDPKILGGLHINCGDLIIDMSLANRVSDLSFEIKK